MLVAAGVVAQTASGFVSMTNQTPGLAVTLQPGEPVGHEQVVRGLIRSGTHEFLFVVPEGLRTETAPEGTIVLLTRDLSFFVSIRIVPPSGQLRSERSLAGSDHEPICPGERPGRIHDHRR